MTNEALNKVTTKLFGFPGTMLDGSKSNRDIVYNANVCTKKYGKIWFGDLNLKNKITLNALKELSQLLNEPIYILREMDARFQTENNPNFDEPVYVVKEE